jgi:putative endonuclease
MSNASERRTALRFGLSAEIGAAWFLRFKGYRILARRLRVEGGRIDLVALETGTLLLIEVKARNGLAIAREAITPTQQKRIATASRAWIARHPDQYGADTAFRRGFLRAGPLTPPYRQSFGD